MIKTLTKLTLLVLVSVQTFAQNTLPATTAQPQQQRRRNQPRPYAITIVNDTKVKVDTAKINADFKAVYPSFASADGYRTAREVTMRIIDTNAKDFTLSAKPGEFVVSSKWIKNKKNFADFQNNLQEALHKNWISVDTTKQDGYQLVFINKNAEFSPNVKKELIEAFFKVYPVLVSTFNDKTTHEVVFVTDTIYNKPGNVAEASGNRILFSPKYMKAHPTDIDIVTHEGFHLVQGYGYSAGPVWLTEGIADYIRYRYGVDNIGSKWYLPAFKSTQSYKNSYRVTARFFEWIDQKIKPGVAVALDKELRAHTYTEATWAALTGKSVDELWADYAKEPEIPLKYSGKERN
jgi:hypothetical protein